MATKKLCDKCGAECHIDDKFCKRCSYSFFKDTTPPLDGVTLEELEEYVGRNADYYPVVLRKTKDKKIFFQWHWPAFLFGLFWYAYRRMYQTFFLLLVLFAALSVFSSVCVPLMVSDKIEAYTAAEDRYNEVFNSDISIDDPVYAQARDEYHVIEGELKDIKKLSQIPFPVFHLLTTFLANFFYRKRILETIHDAPSKGGTSPRSVFICIAVFVPLALIISTLINMIPTVAVFNNATSLV